MTGAIGGYLLISRSNQSNESDESGSYGYGPATLGGLLGNLLKKIEEREKEIKSIKQNESLCLSRFTKMARVFGMEYNEPSDTDFNPECFSKGSLAKLKKLDREITELQKKRQEALSQHIQGRYY